MKFSEFSEFRTPNEEIWPDVNYLPDFKSSFPQWKKKPLSEAVPSLDANGIDLLDQMLVYDPSRRISAKRALIHPYFNDNDDRDHNNYNEDNIGIDKHQNMQ